MVRTDGGHQANGHIESNGKASALGAAATPWGCCQLWSGAAAWYPIKHMW